MGMAQHVCFIKTPKNHEFEVQNLHCCQMYSLNVYIVLLIYVICQKIYMPIFFFQDMFSDNPWQVDSLHDFWFLKCPECIFDTREENHFQDHALENHPLSFVLFGKKCKEEENELYDANYEDGMENYDDEIDNDTSNSINPDVKIEEEENNSSQGMKFKGPGNQELTHNLKSFLFFEMEQNI